MEKELANYLIKYGNFSDKEAEEKAAKLLPMFLEGCEEFEMLGHKGLKWFAKEVCKKTKLNCKIKHRKTIQEVLN